ncbi:MAG: hypothetical protein JW751_26230 [Polyangiaceae bacterium]|nr:hypothetical protein [Polyangiaceae bacterium]
MLRHTTAFVLTSLLATLTVTMSGLAAEPTAAECISAHERATKLQGERKLRSAREQYVVCASASCPSEVRDECAQAVAEVNRALPTVVFAVRDAQGHDLAEVNVTMDGKTLVDRLDGAAIEVDPGEHEFSFAVPGVESVVRKFVVREGEKERREQIEVGAALPSSEPSLSQPTEGAASPSGTNAGGATDEAPKPGRERRTIGFLVTGLGVAALGLGGVFGLLANSAKRDYEDDCGDAVGAPSNTQCGEDGVEANDRARLDAAVSTGLVVGGAVAAVTGVTLVLSAPKRRAQVAIGTGPGSVIVTGRF